MAEELTEQQAAKLEEYRKMSFEIGNSTAPIDRKEAREAITDLYLEVGLIQRRDTPVQPTDQTKIIPVVEDMNFIFVRSPWEMSRLEHILTNSDPDEKILNSLGGDNDDEIINALISQDGPCTNLDYNAVMFGSEESYWVYYTKFQTEVMGEKYDDKERATLAHFERLTKVSYWHLFFDRCFIICDRPREKHLDDRGRLHCTTGPAIRFSDDRKLYYIDGHRIPKSYIEAPESITIPTINVKGLNSETKRIAIEIYGISRYLMDVNAKLIDMDSRNIVGASTRALISDDDGNKFLIGTDGSTGRVYHMAVSSTAMTCKEAHESISGLPEELMIAES